MSDPAMPLSEALLATLAMVIVLMFVLFYYCVLPCYNNYKTHQWTRTQSADDWENDPRWNTDKFQFVPRKPKDYLTDKKYSRLGACSRTSSMRSNNPLLDGAQDVAPSLDIEAAVPAIPTLTGTAKPRQKPPKYSDIYKINGKSGSSGSVSSTNTSSLSNPPEYSSKTPSVERNLNQEQPHNGQNQSQTNPTVGTTNATPPKVKIMKPPKKNRKPPTSVFEALTSSTNAECTNECKGMYHVCGNQGEATPSQKFFNS